MGRALVQKRCERCGQEFSARVAALKIGKGRFCSHKCANTVNSRLARKPARQGQQAKRDYMRAWNQKNAVKQRERRKQYRLANMEQVRSTLRRYTLKRRYGITEADYQRMLAAQDGRCAICRTNEPPKHKDGSPKRWHVDHDHLTGVVRGLLCRSCNNGLGHFRDSAHLLMAALTYVKKPTEPPKKEIP
jgi:hypothetical protein